MSEKTKINFRNTIFGLLKDVKPDAQSLCMIKWVPIKSGQTKEFLHGRYIPKVIIEKGAKDNLYSYVHEKV
jgi:hypothetical protein